MKKINVEKKKDVEDLEASVEPTDDEGNEEPTSFIPKMIKKVKHKWITKDIAQKLGREYELKITLKDLVHFGIFFILITVVSFNNINQYHFYLTSALKLQFEHEKLMEIDSVQEFWEYIEDVFVENLYWETWYGPNSGIPIADEDDKNILYENKLVGVARIRQLKVRNDSCVIHKYFAFAFSKCYGEYNYKNEDKSTFGLATGTAWIYNEQKIVESPKEIGTVAVYGGGGYFQDLATNKADTVKIIKELKDNLWIRRSTRCVMVDFTVYNANLNVFCMITFLFEFPPTGGVITSSVFHTLKLLRYFHDDDYLVMACEFLCLAYIVYFTIEEVRDLTFLKWDYFKEFWSYVDCAIILISYVVAAISIYRFIVVSRKLKSYRLNQDKYQNLEYVTDLLIHFNNLSALVLFFVYIKIFKFINFNKTMGQLNITLSKCKKDVFGFSIMFLIIFVAFAALGYLLFGTEAEDFNDFGYSMLTLLKTILGDFDYKQIERANPFLAPFYFLLFIFLVFFVLLNMFLAIINDTYTDVKTEIALGPQELQMSEVVMRGYYNLLIKLGCKRFVKPRKVKKNELTVTFEEIRAALKNCGFTDLEIEMFFARYNVDPTAKVGDFDVGKLVEELEGRQGRTQRDNYGRSPEEGPVVGIDDFVEQQARLEKIESTVGKLTVSLQLLLKKLDTLESVRKTVRE